MSLDTMHNYSLIDIEAIARALGFSVVESNPSSRHGPDLILKYGDIVVYVESEVGHDVGSGKGYYLRLVRRLERRRERDDGLTPFLVIVANTPRRLASALEEVRGELRRAGFRRAELGRDVFIVPALLYRELVAAILVRILAATPPV